MHFKELSLEDKRHALEKAVNRRLLQLTRKESKLLSLLEACEKWQEVQHEADLLKYSLPSLSQGVSSIDVEDFLSGESRTLILDRARSPLDQMKALYKKAKKLERGKTPLLRHLKETREEKAHLAAQKELLFSLQTEEAMEELIKALALPPLVKQTPMDSQKGERSSYCREFLSSTGMMILVGKNAKGNDQLTFRRAKGNDWWLHARGYAGSHVVIPTHPQKPVDSKTIQEACQLALYFSKARPLQETEVCLTQRKWVARLGRKAGQVQIANERAIVTRLDQEILKRWHL